MGKISKKNNAKSSGTSYYPSSFLKEIMIVMMLVFILVSFVLTVCFPVGLEDPADPIDNLYVPKPEWYFISLYQLLKYIPGKLEAIAAAVVPAGGLAVLLLLPFIDRNPEKRLRKRPIAMAVMGLAVGAIILLTAIGVASY